MLNSIGSQFGKGGSGLTDGQLANVLKELQSRTTVVLAGVAANTNMAVAGIKTTDTIVSALAFNAGVPSDILGTMSITSAGNVQSTVVHTGHTIVLEYCVKP